MADHKGSTAHASAELERETGLIVSAMRLVSGGGATRAIVAGLRLTEAALRIAAVDAADLGVIVERIARPDRQGHDVLIRPRLYALLA